MSVKKAILTVVILLLIAGNVFAITRYFMVFKECQQLKSTLNGEETNGKVLSFTNLFIKHVLKAQGEVDFETRLKLENAVREIDDQEILAQWQKFTESRTEAEAQLEVKNLLEMLVKKIK
ncbi:MAG: hypothetical protein PHD51_02975 [Patescibacteria group bacterium]|nr:hypothetical protein [Patescibacteria group bacterium]MDD5490182.1 hypothetical protein [Patescibacteria group bacterium]